MITSYLKKLMEILVTDDNQTSPSPYKLTLITFKDTILLFFFTMPCSTHLRYKKFITGI